MFWFTLLKLLLDDFIRLLIMAMNEPFEEI